MIVSEDASRLSLRGEQDGSNTAPVMSSFGQTISSTMVGGDTEDVLGYAGSATTGEVRSASIIETSEGTPMARTDNDTWDINESVGATALGVAGGRAKETKSADPLISDPYAELFLEAAGDGIWRVYLDDELPAQLADVDPQFEDRRPAMVGDTACRT